MPTYAATIVGNYEQAPEGRIPTYEFGTHCAGTLQQTIVQALEGYERTAGELGLEGLETLTINLERLVPPRGYLGRLGEASDS